MKGHVVLLGDSIFDNGAYTGREPDVATYLSALLPEWRTTLMAARAIAMAVGALAAPSRRSEVWVG